MKIVLLKEPSILRDLLINTLKKYLPNDDCVAFSSRYYQSLLNHQHLSDLLIIDLDVKADIFDLIKKYQWFNKKIIVWTTNINHKYLIHLFRLNLNGYFYNGMEEEEFFNGIDRVLHGKTYIHQELTPILYNDYLQIQSPSKQRPVSALSIRQWQVLELLVNGYTNVEIGERLFISEKTVKNHVSNILDILNVSSRVNAVLLALKNRWFTISELQIREKDNKSKIELGRQ